MARGAVEIGIGGRCCSFKRITVAICCMNLVVALFLLRSLYISLRLDSTSGSDYNPSSAGKHAEDQIKRIEESIRVRKASEPLELVKVVKKLRKEFAREEKRRSKLPQPLKQKLANEILQRLKDLDNNANMTEQRAAVELWRVEKLEEAKQARYAKSRSNSSILMQEAKMLRRAFGSNWPLLLEDIGLWLPPDIINTENNDKPENDPDLEEEIIPGRPLPPECHAELHTDYDGAAVRWGLTHHKESAADCCQACLDQAKHAKPGQMKCNIWVYCPSEFGCYSPDIYEHKHQECWLKQAQKPRLNFKDKYSESYRDAHPNAPVVVPWISGVVGA
ncbi:uncharacterized protein [Elaeis guineensis]|uniref:Uncharacterized protein LOC105060867 isoform X1 n=1 Tax=Elaeis guineensis var. tenera TaxID=51953 RepID=A0A6I9SFR4_ELAGV|nr:uncharacterized protein LOC105060867 isoform X1 [Elaeis guineensis]